MATENMALEEQVRELQAQIDFLKSGGMGTSMSKRLQAVRRSCRNKYFGTWNEMRDGDSQYGPDRKTYSDYDAIMDIVKRTTGLVFKYSRGKGNGAAVITNLIRTEDDLKDYGDICEMVCRDLKENILQNSNAERK